jgi:putative transposase
MGDRTVPATAGTARHVVQRGMGGAPCFFSDEDYLVYLDCLKEASEHHEGAIHAYVLMPDHVQLLVSLDSETRLARLLGALGGRYVEYVNYTHRRTGEFWDAEPGIAAIDGGKALLGCYREVETAPVRARLAPGPADYRWSSHRHHACGAEDAVIRDHPAYLGLGTTQLARQLAYEALFREPCAGRAGIRPVAVRDPALDAERVEDGIQRSVRGLAWQNRTLRERIWRARPLGSEARVEGNTSDIAQARAGMPRRLASK